jgi:flagella basal body P-ring formation protein FlgA
MWFSVSKRQIFVCSILQQRSIQNEYSSNAVSIMSRNTITRAFLLTGLLGLQFSPAHIPLSVAGESGIQALADISSTAEQFALAALDADTYTNIEVEAQALDGRLRLKQCELPLQAFSNVAVLKAGRTTIGVRCDGASPWSLYVPVNISANVAVVMIKGPVTRGTILGPANLQLVQMPVAQLPPNYVSSIDQVTGRELARAVNRDSFATAALLKQKNMIQKGQTVIILAQCAGFEVRMGGTALENGQRGERISVKNNNSGRTIEGKVVAENVIAVSL